MEKQNTQQEKFIICEDSRFGFCIKTNSSFKKGEIITTISPEIVLESPNLHTVQVRKNFHIYDRSFAGMIAHSCNPNMYFSSNDLIFYARKNITAGVILTQDYEETEDYLYQSFYCKCGSKCCRKEIYGKEYSKLY